MRPGCIPAIALVAAFGSGLNGADVFMAARQFVGLCAPGSVAVQAGEVETPGAPVHATALNGHATALSGQATALSGYADAVSPSRWRWPPSSALCETRTADVANTLELVVGACVVLGVPTPEPLQAASEDAKARVPIRRIFIMTPNSRDVTRYDAATSAHRLAQV
ncbi:MAG: hypothetical protein NVS3B16_19750 [Vulcanimicrobiaceae bacterium]